MKDYNLQAIRAALTELQGDIKADAGPVAQRKIHVVSGLLAHTLARAERELSCDTVEDELATQRDLAGREPQIIADASRTTGQADLSVEDLTTYVRSRLGAEVTVLRSRIMVGGASKQTIILGLENAAAVGDALVIRRDLPGGPVESFAADEYDILLQLHKRGIPVAEPLWLDRSPPFGETCVVTRFVRGEHAFDLTDTSNRSNGREACLALARVLGTIHSIPLSELEIPLEGTDKSLYERTATMIDHYENQWRRRRVGESPTIKTALAWLRGNIPVSGNPALVHGDASLRNLMMEDGRETALLDWELWHVGDPAEDLAYCQVDVDSRLDWHEFLSEYRLHGGREIDPQALEFWKMFGGVRNLIFAAALEHSFVDLEWPHATAAFMTLVAGRPLTEMVADFLKKS